MFDKNLKTVLIAAALAAVLIFIDGFLLDFGGDVTVGLCIALIITFFPDCIRELARYRAPLAERAEQPATDADNVMWDVTVNDVHVTTLADTRLAAFQNEVAGDWRNMLTQALNVLYVQWRMFEHVIILIPIIAFWLIFACAVFTPDSLVQTFTAIRHAAPRELHHAVNTALHMLLAVGVLTFLLNWIFTGSVYGLRNVYRDELEYASRKYLGIAATGRLRISRTVHDTTYRYEPDIFGWLSTRSRAARSARAERARKA